MSPKRNKNVLELDFVARDLFICLIKHLSQINETILYNNDLFRYDIFLMTSGTFLWVEDRFSQCNNYQAHESMRRGLLEDARRWFRAVVEGDGR